VFSCLTLVKCEIIQRCKMGACTCAKQILHKKELTFNLLLWRIGRAPNSIPLYSYIQQDCNVTQFIYIWKLLYMFRVALPPIIRSAYNCIYSIWDLSHRYCYLPLSWKSWNRFECAVGGVQHTYAPTHCPLSPLVPLLPVNLGPGINTGPHFQLSPHFLSSL
jgi:hypothetical protein